MLKKSMFGLLFILSLTASVAAFIWNNDMFRFPMILAAAIFMALWQFQPKKGGSLEGDAAYYALIGYGVFSIILSFILYIVIPLYGEQWGVEYNPNDAGGVVYPIVNDGHENCIFTTTIFLIYFGIVAYRRWRSKMQSV